jgi:hypothetical protein
MDDYVFTESGWERRGRDIDDESKRLTLESELRGEVSDGHVMRFSSPLRPAP